MKIFELKDIKLIEIAANR